jgi:hypothetical protein
MRADIVPGRTFPDYELTDHPYQYQAEHGQSPSAADMPSAATVPGGA